jgi:hypothetical protein
MCFSAEASFIGAIALTVIATATLKTPLRKQDKFWGIIPLFFALQQFSEGIVWLDLRGSIPHSAFSVFAKDLYLLFALALWPIWLPFSFLIAETQPKQKNCLKILFLCGILLAWINLSTYSILDLSPSVNKYSIYYLSEGAFYKKAAYLFVVSLPPLISSLRYMKVFGILIIICCLVAEYFYATTFTSVWCFLASFASAALYLISRANIREDLRETSKGS